VVDGFLSKLPSGGGSLSANSDFTDFLKDELEALYDVRAARLNSQKTGRRSQLGEHDQLITTDVGRRSKDKGDVLPVVVDSQVSARLTPKHTSETKADTPATENVVTASDGTGSASLTRKRRSTNKGNATLTETGDSVVDGTESSTVTPRQRRKNKGDVAATEIEDAALDAPASAQLSHMHKKTVPSPLSVVAHAAEDGGVSAQLTPRRRSLKKGGDGPAII
jgi:hypothetical protein